MIEFDAAEWEPLIRRQVRSRCRGPLPAHTSQDDLVQDTLVSVWRSLPSFTGTREDLPKWIYRIAQRRVAEAYRTAARRPVDLVPDLDDAVTTNVDEVEAAAITADLTALLARLDNPRYRQVLALRAQDQSYQQIADTLGITFGAVRTAIHRARRSMRGEPVHKTKRVLTHPVDVADIQWRREHLDRDLGDLTFLVDQFHARRPVPPLVLVWVRGVRTVHDWPSARRLAAAHLAEVDRVRTVWAPVSAFPLAVIDLAWQPRRATA